MKDFARIIGNLTFGIFMAFALPVVLFYAITVDKEKLPNKIDSILGICMVAVATIILGFLIHILTGLSTTYANWAVYLSICIGFAITNNLTNEDLFSYADKKE